MTDEPETPPCKYPVGTMLVHRCSGRKVLIIRATLESDVNLFGFGLIRRCWHYQATADADLDVEGYEPHFDLRYAVWSAADQPQNTSSLVRRVPA